VVVDRRMMEVLALLCVVACVPLLSSRGGLLGTRRGGRETTTRRDERAAGGLHDVNNHDGGSNVKDNTNVVLNHGNGNSRVVKTAEGERGEGTGVGYAAASASSAGGGVRSYGYGGAMGRKGGAASSAAQLERLRASTSASETATHTTPSASAFEQRAPQWGADGSGRGGGDDKRNSNMPLGNTAGVCGGDGREGGDSIGWDGVDIRGGDLPAYRFGPPLPAPATPFQCCQACLREPECKGWVLVKDGGMCWLKGWVATHFGREVN
jgi:hypothetical protein